MASRTESFKLWGRDFVRIIVGVLDGRSLGEAFAEGRLFLEHGSDRGVTPLPIASIQSLAECVNYTDLEVRGDTKRKKHDVSNFRRGG